MATPVDIDYEPENLPSGSVVITAPALIAYSEPGDAAEALNESEEN